MKKRMSILLIVLMTVLVCFTQGSVLRATEAESSEIIDLNEKKVYSSATVDGDFADDHVLLVLNKQETMRFKDYSVRDFSDSNVFAVEELTQSSREVVQEQIYRQRQQINSDNSETVRESEAMEIDADSFRSILRLTLRNPGKENVIDAIKKLEQRDDVLLAEPDWILTLDAAPNPTPTNYNNQWGLRGANGISAEAAWDITTGSNAVRVGVIDTGIQGNHPDLVNRVNVGLSRDFTIASPHTVTTVTDGGEHGTHVAGIIGANRNAGTPGVIGVNWNVQLVSLRINDGPMTSTTFASRIVMAVNYATTSYATAEPIQILNNSNGLDNFTGTANDRSSVETAIRSYPGLFVTSAGNAARDNDANANRFPSNIRLPNLITVGATNANGTLATATDWGWPAGSANGSNWGANNVDIFAPGTGIWSTVPTNRHESWNGTSMATPMVAGTAALIKSIFPNMSAEAVKAAILAGVDIPNIGGTNPLQGRCVTNGRLNAYKALNCAAKYQAGRGLTVSGDFNGDGFADLAVFYNLNNSYAELHVWLSNGSELTYDGVWWRSLGYHFDVTRIDGHVMTADLDGCGKDEIVAFYDHLNNNAAIYTFIPINSGSGWYFGVAEWGFPFGFNASRITGRAVAGDFDGCGKDEIVTFYDHLNNNTAIYTFISVGPVPGLSFGVAEWGFPFGFNASRITGRVVAGDFDGCGKDEIATFYDHLNNNTAIYTFIPVNSGSGWYFGVAEWGLPFGFDSSRITGRVVAGDFDGCGKDEIVTFYDFSNNATAAYTFISVSSSVGVSFGVQEWGFPFSFDASRVTNRIAAGNFTGMNAKSEIVAIYDFGNSTAAYAFFPTSLLPGAAFGVAEWAMI